MKGLIIAFSLVSLLMCLFMDVTVILVYLDGGYGVVHDYYIKDSVMPYLFIGNHLYTCFSLAYLKYSK